MKTFQFIATLVLAVSFFTIQAQTKSNYKIANKIHLEGDEKWDYLYSDDDAGMLYISHGSIVQIVDEAKGQVVGKITGLIGVHGIAIAPALNKGFISNGKDNSVTIFDTKTLQVITNIKVGSNPDAILFDPFSKKVFTFNGKSNNSTVINTETNQIETTIALAGKPEFAVSDKKGKVYVNFEEESKVCQINTEKLKVENVWPLAPGEGPTGLALDNKNHRLFSVCGNKLMIVMDALTGKVITSLTIGDKADGVAFDPELQCAYSSNGEGTMTVVKGDGDDKFSVAENFTTQKGAKTIAVNRKTHHLYLSSANFEAAKPGEKGKIIPDSFVILDIAPL
ncbi:MAG: YncE family protein [Bacteroidetes bacterium]|nr:YncE family protein [Bacteroidota bacterium]